MSAGPPDLAALVRRGRRRLLALHHLRRVGHLGGNLSCLDALLALFHRVLGPDDTFLLSKGHGAGALYVALWSAGRLTDAELETFHADGTRLPGHPPSAGLPGVPFGTGSLGHGPSLAAGLALGRRLAGRPGRVFCLTSDGEWQEGSTWEALAFVHHHRLATVELLVDVNGLQGLGSTREIASMDELGPRLEAFGVEVVRIDGHDPGAVVAALATPSPRPRAVLLRTVKGRGVARLEGRFESQYLPLTDADLAAALARLDAEEEEAGPRP